MTSLNINSFTTNGKNYRADDRLDLSEVSAFLEEKWFTVVSITQPWRNAVAEILQNGERVFFKLASTEGIGERLKNEITWNRFWNERDRIWQNAFFVPAIKETGFLGNLPYYVAEHASGDFIARENDKYTDWSDWMPRIVECNLAMLEVQWSTEAFYRDQTEKMDVETRKSLLLQRIFSWADQVPERDLSRLKRYLEEGFKKDIPLGVNHGDFVPWHMIRQADGRFALIDGEHGSAQTPRYYDIAYFYHRVYTKLENPNLAEAYLSEIVRRLPEKESGMFREFFPLLLASRIIGGFFDAKHDRTDFQYHDRLLEKFLRENISE